MGQPAAQSIRRWLVAIAITGFLLALIQLGKFLFLSHIENSWAGLREEIDSSLVVRISGDIAEFTSAAENTATSLARLPELRDLLSGEKDEAGLIERILGRYGAGDISFQAHDSSGKLRVYWGRRIPPVDEGVSEFPRPAILEDGFRVILVVRRSVDRGDGTPLGRVEVSRPLAFTAPLKHRQPDAKDLDSLLSAEHMIEARLVSDPEHPLLRDGRYVSVPVAVNGEIPARIALPRTNPTTYQETTGAYFDRAAAFLGMALLVIVVGFCMTATRGWKSRLARFSAATAALFLGRYGLLLTGAGAALLPDTLMNPAWFASSLGGGLVSSIGELTITLLTFTAAITIALNLSGTAGASEIRLSLAFRQAPVLLAFPFAMRGLTASLKSFVTDASFNYDTLSPFFDDPLFVLMMFNAFLLTAGSITGAWISVRLLRVHGGTRRDFAAAMLVSVVSVILFLAVTRDRLIPPHWYAILSILFAAAPYAPSTVRKLIARRPSLRAAMLVAATTLVVGTLLQQFMNEKRRGEIEAIADRLARPVDAWSMLLAGQAAAEIAAEVAVEQNIGNSLEGANTSRAFGMWARSALAAERNNSAVQISGTDGTLVSRFSVGIHPRALDTGPLAGILSSPTDTTVQVRPEDDPRRRAYAVSSLTTASKNGSPLRIAVIVEALDPLVLTSSEVDLLRSDAIPEGVAPEDRLSISTFGDGILLATSDPMLPHIPVLPAEVRSDFLAGKDRSWSQLPTPDGPRPALFVKLGEAGNGEALCISMGAGEFVFTVYRYLRIGLFFLCLSAAASASMRLLKRPVRWRLEFRFASRLQLAILAAAAIPLLLVWLTARSFVTEEQRRQAEAQLLDDLNALKANLAEAAGADNPAGIASAARDDICIDAATRTGREVSVFAGPALLASSRPELYTAGLLSPRLPPEAFLAIAVRGAEFHMTTEKISDLAYLVGYLALRDSSGRPAVILSSPTLFEQAKAEKASMRASATILLGTVLIALLVLGVSRVLARQISRPLSELTAATQDIAGGDLHRRVDMAASAEIKDLMLSFNAMTDQLQRSRDLLAAAERDLAWKEMAKQVAHEIRNPLTPMKLAAQHLQRARIDKAPNIDEIISAVLGVIIDQVDTLARISDEFSRFARMPLRKPTEVDIGAILRETAALFGHDDNITVDVSIDAQLPPVIADREELSRAFTNILRNSAQAIDVKGSISITAEPVPGGIEIRISDTGIGIHPAALQRIFEPNFSTKTEGMGLGLAIVKRIVDDTGGSIRIESEPGAGAVVIVRLPVSAPSTCPEDPPDGT